MSDLSRLQGQWLAMQMDDALSAAIDKRLGGTCWQWADVLPRLSKDGDAPGWTAHLDGAPLIAFRLKFPEDSPPILETTEFPNVPAATEPSNHQANGSA
jgi:hypothetical protein